MSQPESREILIIASGAAGKHLARHMAAAGHRPDVIERRWIGGSCHNIACLPSKNEIWSARVAHLARHGNRFGVNPGSITIDMAAVRRRKRAMVEREVVLQTQIAEANRFRSPVAESVRLSLTHGARTGTGPRRNDHLAFAVMTVADHQNARRAAPN